MEGQIGPGTPCFYCGMDYGEHSKDCGKSRVQPDTPSTSPPDERAEWIVIGAGLANLRRARGETLRAAAVRHGISAGRLSEMERGIIKPIIHVDPARNRAEEMATQASPEPPDAVAELIAYVRMVKKAGHYHPPTALVHKACLLADYLESCRTEIAALRAERDKVQKDADYDWFLRIGFVPMQPDDAILKYGRVKVVWYDSKLHGVMVDDEYVKPAILAPKTVAQFHALFYMLGIALKEQP